MLIIWSHGQGWIAGNQIKHLSDLSNPSVFDNAFNHNQTQSILGGLAFDYSSKSHFTIPEIRNSIYAFKALYNNDNPIDIIASDACYMQMIEVAYEYSDIARFIIGSAQQEEFAGWPYEKILNLFPKSKIHTVKTNDPVYTIAKQIPKLYQEAYYDETSNYDPKATMSTIRAEALQTIVTQAITPGLQIVNIAWLINNVAQHIYNYLKKDPESKLRLEYALKESISYSPLSIDLYYFISRFLYTFRERPDASQDLFITSLKLSIIELQNAITKSSVNTSLGKSYQYENNSVKGLAIWAPSSKQDLETYKQIFLLSNLHKEMNSYENYWIKIFEYLYSKDNKIIFKFSTL